MKVAYIRARESLFLPEEEAADLLKSDQSKPNSAVKQLLLELLRTGVVTQCANWMFWPFPSREIARPASLPRMLFSADPDGNSEGLAEYVCTHGEPDLIIAAGHRFSPHLAEVFRLCPGSFKVVYSKDCRPWNVAELDRYDLCLVDEEWQIREVGKRYPRATCAVWDKLIDYEQSHFPIPGEKVYDLCYVAHCREGKNHRLLFEAMAKLKGRNLKCVCVGGDREGRLAALEGQAADLGLSVTFTGNVSKDLVNVYINRSRLGIMCARVDGAPRVVLEYMAADVPVLVNAELIGGKRYVGPGAGLVRTPDQFHLGIVEILDDFQRYSPRAYFLQHFSRDAVVAKFLGLLKQAGLSAM